MNFYHGFRGLGVLFGSFFYMCVFSGTCMKGEGGREGSLSQPSTLSLCTKVAKGKM